MTRVHSAIAEAAGTADSGGQLECRGIRTVVLDVKAEVDRLYSSYLTEAVRLSLAGFAAIVVLLLLSLRSPARVIGSWRRWRSPC